MIQNEILSWMEENGILRRYHPGGEHFAGEHAHSDCGFNMQPLLRYPHLSAHVAKLMHERLPLPAYDAVVSAEEAARDIAHSLAALSKKPVFDIVGNGKTCYWTDPSWQPGESERLLIVRAVVRVRLREHGIAQLVTRQRIVGTAALLVAGGGGIVLDFPITPLARLRPTHYLPQYCPLCAEGSPAITMQRV